MFLLAGQEQKYSLLCPLQGQFLGFCEMLGLNMQIPKEKGQKSYPSQQVLSVFGDLPKSMLVARVRRSLSYVCSALQGLTLSIKQPCPVQSTCSFHFLKRIALYASFTPQQLCCWSILNTKAHRSPKICVQKHS